MKQILKNKKGMELQIIMVWLLILIIAVVLFFLLKYMYTSGNGIVDIIGGMF